MIRMVGTGEVTLIRYGGETVKVSSMCREYPPTHKASADEDGACHE